MKSELILEITIYIGWYNIGQIYIDTITQWNWRPTIIKTKMICEFEKIMVPIFVWYLIF
jgi:hypothetical protein